MKPARRIRLLHCLGRLQTGGRELQLAALVERLPREEFEQKLVLLQEIGEAGLAERFRAAGCEVTALGWTMRRRWFDPRAWIAGLDAARGLENIAKDFDADIIHGWLFWPAVMAALAGRPAARRGGAKTSACAIVSSRLRLPLPGELRGWEKFLRNWANGLTSAIHANAAALCAEMEREERNTRGKCRVIYNGIDAAQFSEARMAALRGPARAALGLLDGEFAILYTANLHPYKGHGALIHALAHLRASRVVAASGLTPILLFAGQDKGQRATLEKTAAKLGLGGAVRFLGRRDDVAELLTACDLYAHPSLSEGFSNAVLEAMAAGRAIVASRIAGIPEAIEDGKSGFLITPNDAFGTARAIEILLLDAALRAQLGAAARARAATQFSFERIAAQFEEWYAGLASG